MSYCKIICMGRLTRDPELRAIPSGTPVCEFGIAFDNGWGENKKTCFVDITVWGKQAEFVNKFFKKGDGIHLDGRLEYDTWEDKQSGAKRSKHRIVAERVTFPVGAGKGQGAQQAQASVSEPSQWSQASADEIPF